MKCPNCEGIIEPYAVAQYLELASDGSYALAQMACDHCGECLELYYPLKSINDEEV